jgi:AraC family transcriptional regulator, regulatory protein of adaptative response / DNA-3-methyladenine glycosylase II
VVRKSGPDRCPDDDVRKQRAFTGSPAYHRAMRLDPETCYRAVRARDPRFDGRFFVGVSSTGVYCRPVCTVRMPKRENCAFFPSASAAELRGYRPCLRCRPELAPGNASIDARHRIAQAAASLIEDGALNEIGTGGIADRLGVTDRHLRRVFHGEFGVAPIAFAQTQRLLMAKRLLTDTALPVTEVAYAAGFGSLRRFDALFKERYRLSPSGLRKAPTRPTHPDALTFELSFRPPYDWPSLIDFLRARSVNAVEEADTSSYRRTVRIAQNGQAHTGWVEITPHRRKPVLRAAVSASLAKVLPALLSRVKHLMDLSCNPAEVAEVLGPLAAAKPGLRVPGAFDGFEVAVRAVLGQQVSVAAARTLAGRFAAAFGTPVGSPFSGLCTTFPASERIAELTAADISGLGVLPSRARTIIELAKALARDQVRLTPGADVTATLDSLRSIPGVGEWTAQYIAMRALAWPDAFPHTDLGVMKALGERTGRRVLAAADRWRPWRAYAVMHLWAALGSGGLSARRSYGSVA